MLFNSIEFIIFFTIVYLIYIVSPHKMQNRLLLLASYFFYGMWDWRFLSLIITSTIIDYFCGIKIQESSKKSNRQMFVIISLCSNLSILGFFKYFNFFVDSLIEVTTAIGVNANIQTLNIILPVGISFYTFQTLSYTLDIYRKEIKPEKNFFDFALFVSFFPQLVAGPIERAKHLIPQISKPRKITINDFRIGVWLIIFGYFLKVFVADNLAPIVDHTFSKSGILEGSEVITSVYAFAFQIFGDFAGYSSIAIGISRLMGITLMTNFLYPYFVTNPQEFWNNWHISLSTWLRDYLYISLGGNRKGKIFTYRNLFLTMLLGGIWHGAAWNFVIWGIYQGSILIIHRLLSPYLSCLEEKSKINKYIWKIIKVFTMFQITCYGWLIFRADSFQQLINLTKSIFTNFSGFSAIAIYNTKAILYYTVALLAIQIYQLNKKDNHVFSYLRPSTKAACYLALYLFIITLGEFGSNEFIYFQF